MRSIDFSSTQEAPQKNPSFAIGASGRFVTHFFTVRDQEKSKDFYVRILGGKVI